MTDPRVMYSEPAKFVAKLREMKTNDNLLLFKCEMGAGHFSKSGRYDFITRFMTGIIWIRNDRIFLLVELASFSFFFGNC